VLYHVLKYVVLGPPLRVIFRPWAEGLGNVPEEGPAILASNHLSFSDSFFLPLVVPKRQIYFVGKSEYFTGTGLKGRFNKAFFSSLGTVPIDRSGGTASEAALRIGMQILRRGDLFGIYPEGTRSPDGRLYRGRTGIARLALKTGVPVVPVAMVDTDKIQPPGKIIPKVARVGVKIGKPLHFSRYQGMDEDRFILRSVTDEIMYELMLLSGREYVDMYATKAKALASGDTGADNDSRGRTPPPVPGHEAA